MNIELLNSLKKYNVICKFIKFDSDKSNKFNDIVKQLYVINLKEDVYKRNYIHLLFSKLQINYTIIMVDRADTSVYNSLFPSKNISIGEFGCCLSHMWCLMHIIKHKFENAIIFEDDVILSKTFISKFIQIYENNKKLDFLMLGAHDFNFSNHHFRNIKDGLYRPTKFTNLYGAHANFYSFSAAKRMFYIRATNLSFFDNEYNLLFNSVPNSFICYPNLVIANMTESKLNHEKNILSQNEIIYFLNCFINLNLNNYYLLYHNLLDLSLLKNDDTVETFIEHNLFRFFNTEQVNIIKQRFVLDFFTIDDIKHILSNYDLSQMITVPNNLSKKCIGEQS